MGYKSKQRPEKREGGREGDLQTEVRYNILTSEVWMGGERGLYVAQLIVEECVWS